MDSMANAYHYYFLQQILLLMESKETKTKGKANEAGR
jgi:hypothetical protein